MVIAAASAAPEIEAEPVCPDESMVDDAGAGRGPLKLHPAMMKAYRVEVCYWGTLALEAARDSYLGSLRRDPPSASKLPVFPAERTPGARNAYEREARACAVATALREPPTPIDEALAAYAPFATELAKDIATAALYYKNEEFKQDGFAAGASLDARLLEGFSKLAVLRERLGAAMLRYEKQRPGAACAREPTERAALRCVETARSTVRALLAPPMPGEHPGFDESARCVETLHQLSAEHPTAPWPKILVAPLERFAGLGREQRFQAGALGPDEKMSLSQAYVLIVEARQRAATRAALTRAAGPAPPSP